MNVTELIELTNQLSIDGTYITDKQRQQYLRYLNMANRELYQIAAGGLKTIVKKATLFLTADSQTFQLPSDLYTIRAIFVDKIKLSMSDLDQAFEISANRYLVLGNQLYLNLSASGLTFPVQADSTDNQVKRYITFYYVPNPLKLVEDISDPLTETDTPVYPMPFHHFLVDGALYYFYFPNKVFIEKMPHILRKWEDNKTALGNFNNYGL